MLTRHVYGAIRLIRGLQDLFVNGRPERAGAATVEGAFIPADQFTRMYQHCERQAGSHEVMGLLLGDHFVDSIGAYTYIFQSISGSYESNMVHVRFTKAGIADISSALADFKSNSQYCPIDRTGLNGRVCPKCSYDVNDTKIVGWYHSHPGHTAFMSGTDLETQRNNEFVISIVIDPLHEECKVWQSVHATLQEIALYAVE